MSRGFKITRSDYSDKDSSDRVGWLDDFAKKLEAISNAPKSAVEVARNRNQQSILDQISQIVSKKTITSKNFESAVQELQDRVGLKEYLKRVSASENILDGQKQISNHNLGEIFKDLPKDVIQDIDDFIRNMIEYTHHGNIQVPPVVEAVKNTFKQVQPYHVNDNRFEKYVSDLIAESKKRNPSRTENNHNIGRGVGLENTQGPTHGDFFEGIMTAHK